MSADLTTIERYFPTLTAEQLDRLSQLPDLYKEWNEKINVVSRRDIDQILEHHILHSMVIGRYTSFRPGTRIIDVGTGGGLPGIPLAILFPECHFTLIDGTGKKIRVTQAIADAIGLTNVEAVHTRSEEWLRHYHFIVSRAAMDLSDLVRTSGHLIDRREQINALPNGIITLKGGDLSEELRPFRKSVEVTEIKGLYPELEYYDTKKIIYLPLH